MFKCENCGDQQGEKISPNMTVSVKRPTYYQEVRDDENEIIANRGQGWEIVKEVRCCATCAPKVEAKCIFVKR